MLQIAACFLMAAHSSVNTARLFFVMTGTTFALAKISVYSLVNLITDDENEQARMKALLELSRVGKANPTMLIEHIDSVIAAIKDTNKHVRRLAVWTINSMAEAIPLEAQEAIPALREALHDEYHLVRMFADKALNSIRSAMRK